MIRMMIQRDSMSSNFLFQELQPNQVEAIVDAIFPVNHPAGNEFITQGHDGDNWYLIRSGIVDIFVARAGEQHPGKLVCSATTGESFGETALLHSCARAATCVARTDCSLWALDRSSFQSLVVRSEIERHTQRQAFLEEVPLLQILNRFELTKLDLALTTRTFEPGDTIIAQGDEEANEMFILECGEATAWLSKGGGAPVQVMKYSRGNYFGEVALLAKQPRAATVRAVTACSCLCLPRTSFERLFGPLLSRLAQNTSIYKKYTDVIADKGMRATAACAPVL
eukprot:GHVT01019243.1.p1 GENE.GHVT01019243.1~~GHVT01019243.1.p1  ORF type:complete len:282 (+),score=51.05 GHVT01019243.1:4339-5184(+)